MDGQIFKFLESKCSKETTFINKLFISAFLKKNNYTLNNNILLESYLITSEEESDYELLRQFIEIIEIETDVFDFELLIELYEFVVSPADKVINGAIYTPKYIRKFIVNQIFQNYLGDVSRLKISDIACGCGGFLFDAVKLIRENTNKTFFEIFQDNIFGLDIQEYSVVRTKLLLSLLAVSEGEDVEYFNFNLFIGDALTFSFEEHIREFNGFDFIVGNPPYVCSRHLSQETKTLMERWSVSRVGHPDLYIPFFQIAFENLSHNGWLGYITMNSFFKSLNGRALREYFKEREIRIKIIDFSSEQIFKSHNTYTCICIIQNAKQPYVEYSKLKSIEIENQKDAFNKIFYKNLDSFKGWNLDQHDKVSCIESIGCSLGEKYKSRHGIATLKNHIYIFKPIDEDENFYYLNNQCIYPIEKGICRNIINSNRLSNKVAFPNLLEKIIFPYDDNQKPQLLNEDVFREKYPFAYNYLFMQKTELAKRDKGKGKYENWFAFGRSQSLEKTKYKLFFPKISDKIPHCIINSDENLLFYNGQAFIGKSVEELILIKRIMESRLFWYYIKSTSKPYSADYYSLNGNYIKNFGIYDFTEEEKEFLINENDRNLIDSFLEDKYEIEI